MHTHSRRFDPPPRMRPLAGRIPLPSHVNRQIRVLLGRNVRLLTLDPTLLVRMVALVVTMVFFGIIYIVQRDKVPPPRFQRAG